MAAITFPQLGKLGRTANSMFQAASTIGIAHKNNLFYFFPEWEYQKYFINKLPTKDDIKVKLRPYKTISESSFSYQDFTLSDNYNYEIKNSYLQSWKYWIGAEHLVKKYFEFQPNLVDNIYKVWDNVLSSNITCSVHFRLKDYIQFSDYHTNLQLTDYYRDSTKLMESQNYTDEPTKYIIFSDDVEWCKANSIKLLDDNIHPNNVLFSESQGEVEDMVLMSLCTNSIIANSSFSWMSAFLNKNESKIVVSPSGLKYSWFGFRNTNSTVDLIPKDWIKL